MQNTPRKSDLRQTGLAARQAIASTERWALDAAICANILRHVEALPIAVFAGYVAARGEADIRAVLEALALRGVQTVLPCIESKEGALAFRSWKPGETLSVGPYGISYPELSSSILVPEVMLVPLVAFDRRGHRLGYGGGYYDRTLAVLRAENPALKAIGVAYACQEAPAIPDEGHDARLDAVVTEKELITC